MAQDESKKGELVRRPLQRSGLSVKACEMKSDAELAANNTASAAEREKRPETGP